MGTLGLRDVSSKTDAVIWHDEIAHEKSLTTRNKLKGIEVAKKAVNTRTASKKVSLPKREFQVKFEVQSSYAGKTNATKNSVKKETRDNRVQDGKIKLEAESDEENRDQKVKAPKEKKGQ